MILIINVDVVRARSSKFEEYTGIPLVNIPEKGMGAPEHVCVVDMPSGFHTRRMRNTLSFFFF